MKKVSTETGKTAVAQEKLNNAKKREPKINLKAEAADAAKLADNTGKTATAQGKLNNAKKTEPKSRAKTDAADAGKAAQNITKEASAQEKLNNAIKKEPRNPRPTGGGSENGGGGRGGNRHKTDSDEPSPSGVGRFTDYAYHALRSSREIKEVWRENYDSLKTYTDETKHLLLAQAKFKMINLSPEDNKKAFDAVTQSVREMGLTTRAEGIETLTDLHTALGNLDHAIEALPLASKYRFAMQTLFSDKFSTDEIESQVQNAFKFLEVTGKVAKGREEMERSFNVMTQMTAATGGRVTPADLLVMARHGTVSMRNLSPEGLKNLSALIQEMGPDTAGASFMTLYESLVAGVGKKSSAEEFMRLGLVSKDKVKTGKKGAFGGIMPGGNVLGDLMMDDPLKAADKLRDAMAAHGINTNDQKAVGKELAILFQNRYAQNVMDMLINQRSQVVKEATLAGNAQNVNQMFSGMDEQLVKVQKLEKAWTEFKTEAGLPLLESGSKLAGALTPIVKFFADHPTVTQWAIAATVAGKALTGILETTKLLDESRMFSFFTRGKESVSQFGTTLLETEKKAGQAGFIKTKESVSNLETVLAGAEKKAGGLKGSFQSLASSPALKLGVTIVGVEAALLAINTLEQHFDELDARQIKVAEDAKIISQTHDSLLGRGMLYNAPGDYKGHKDEFDAQANHLFEGMKEGRTLETSLHPERATWWEYYKNLSELPYGTSDNGTTSGEQFNPTVAAHRWRMEGFSMPLQDPNILARFISKIQSGGDDTTRLNLQDVGLMMKTLEQITSKDKMATALDILKKENYSERPEARQNQTSPLSGTVPPSNLAQVFGQMSFRNLPITKSLFSNPLLVPTAQSQRETADKFQPLSFLKPTTQIFDALKPSTMELAQDFLNLQQPSNSLIEQFLNLNTNSNTAVNGVNNLANATNDAASRISNLQINPPTFAPIQIPGAQPGNSAPIPLLPSIFGKAAGGSVTRGHTYRINEIGQEFFTPAASGSIVPNSRLRNNANAAATAPNVNLTVHINIAGADNPSAAALEIKRELAALVRQINEDFTPRNVARKVAYEAERDSERV